MPIIAAHEPGAFCWPELYTTDQAGSKIFYVRLFGWEIRDIPMGPHAVYTIFTLGGHDAAACYGALPDMEHQGIRPTPGTSNGSLTTLPPAALAFAAVSSLLATHT